VGNALEVAECMAVLGGDFRGAEDLLELTLELAGWMFTLGNRTPDVAAGRALALQLLRSGAALEKFRQMTAAQGGQLAPLDDPRLLPQAARRASLASTASGFVTAIACQRLGTACLLLGGGRRRSDDAIDPAVGLVVEKKLGEAVTLGEPLCTLHYSDPAKLEEALAALRGAWTLGDAPPPLRPLVYSHIGGLPRS
jgi:pyrimidine-nucleoside phosphorylase/thymidine phosphorylase